MRPRYEKMGEQEMKKPRNTFVYVHVNYSKNIIFKVIFVICKVLLYNPYNCCSDTLGFNDLFECARKKKKQNVKLKLKKKKRSDDSFLSSS